MTPPLDRFVVGIEGPGLTDAERRLYSERPPFGFLLLERNLVSATQAAELLRELRSLGDPPPLLFVDQEGGTVDRLGPLLGVPFPSPSRCAARGSDAVHDSAFLMGRAARLLGFDVDLAPVLDLAQPGTGAVVLPGRCFAFHPEDVVVAGMVFLHGLSRAGLEGCLKHFPGLGRGSVDSHLARPVIDADEVDLAVTDVLPFERLSRAAGCVLVGHGAYPGLTGDETPASLSPRVHALLREGLRFEGVVLSDDLNMGALAGTLSERSSAAASAGCDVLVVSRTEGEFFETAARISEAAPKDPAREARLGELRRRTRDAPHPEFTEAAWASLAADASAFVEALEKPRPRRQDDGAEDAGPERT